MGYNYFDFKDFDLKKVVKKQQKHDIMVWSVLKQKKQTGKGIFFGGSGVSRKKTKRRTGKKGGGKLNKKIFRNR